MAQNKYYETQKWELRGTDTGTKRHKAGTKTHNKYDETQRRELREPETGSKRHRDGN